MREHLINIEDFTSLARPTSIHLDEEEVNAYIRECEDAYVIPAIGYAVFKYATQEEAERPTSLRGSFSLDTFLEGGEWTRREYVCGDYLGDGTLTYCDGLKKALAYFVWAKMLKADGSIITRAGAMRHEEDYSRHVEDTSLSLYNDVYDMAQAYLAGCMLYLRDNSQSEVKPVRGRRARVKAIGD